VPSTCTQLGLIFQWAPTGTAGADDSISINGIQVEIGGQASSFEHRHVKVEFTLCQRYFFKLNEPATGVQVTISVPMGTNSQSYVFSVPTPMRTAPTVIIM